MASEVKVDLDQLRNCSNVIKTISGSISETKEELDRNILNDGNIGWAGRARNAFVERFGQSLELMELISAKLKDNKSAIDSMIQLYSQTEEEITDAAGQLDDNEIFM